MHDLRVNVYTRESVVRRPGPLLRAMFRDLADSRQLAWQLAVRDVSAQYRQAFLGLLWAFILPLTNTIAWVFLRQSGVVAFGQTGLPYVAYAASGTILWSIFIDALNAPLQQTQAARNMLAKINFPREALILSGMLQTVLNASVKLLALFAVLISVGVYPDRYVLLAPVGVLSLLLVGTALGLLLTPLGVLYSDVGRALPLFAQFLMYVTPVVFPMPGAGWAQTVFSLNPLSPLLLTTRGWLTGTASFELGSFLAVNAAAVALLFCMWLAYRVAIPIVIERIGA